MVACDTAQISSNGAPRRVESARLQHREKRLLHDVVACRSTAHSRAVLINAPLITSEQLTERRLMPLRSPPEQCRVVHFANILPRTLEKVPSAPIRRFRDDTGVCGQGLPLPRAA